jgi:hypothetical protein
MLLLAQTENRWNNEELIHHIRNSTEVITHPRLNDTGLVVQIDDMS